VQEPVVRQSSEEARKIGSARGNYWFYDGKFAVTDYDRDGDPDVFSSSKRGNLLLRNQNGRFEIVDVAAAGLPPRSTTASWVDFDNDGLPDLHLVPQGMFRQRADHTFEETRILAVDPGRYDAAIVNWADLDNDGRLDVLMALDESAAFSRWWEFRKPPKQRGRWEVVALRNVGDAGHWLQVDLAGDPVNRQGIGAAVSIGVGESVLLQTVGANEGSFFSQGHYRLHFGLGSHAKADAIKVRWSDGYEQVLKEVAANRLVTVVRPPVAATADGNGARQ
jgi:hypothetical protein